MNTLEYAKAVCQMVIRKYRPEELPPVGHFHYHQGVTLLGMSEISKLIGESAYLDYIEKWTDSVIDDEGNIKEWVYTNLDDIMPGVLLFDVLNLTGKTKYEKALDNVYQEVLDINRTDEGGFWHKCSLPGQMWLDGIFMATPFCAQYAKYKNIASLTQIALLQMKLMAMHCTDRNTGLMYHAWDITRKAEWANPVTGCSPEFWGRAMGWLPIGILNALDYVDDNTDGKSDAIGIATELLKAVVRYQSEDGRWYQVVDKGGEAGNWLENSCSCLFVAGLAKAIRLGYLSTEYIEAAKRGYDAVIKTITFIDSDIQIGNVCVGTNVGDYLHYCNRPTRVNDLHAIGAFLIMCAEIEKLNRYTAEESYEN